MDAFFRFREADFDPAKVYFENNRTVESTRVEVDSTGPEDVAETIRAQLDTLAGQVSLPRAEDLEARAAEFAVIVDRILGGPHQQALYDHDPAYRWFVRMAALREMGLL